MTSLTLTFTTPRKPWSRFLNLRWSKIWTAMTEFSLTVLVHSQRITQLHGAMHAHVEALVPVRVQRLLHDAGSVSLLRIDGDDGEGIGETEDFALGQAIGGDNCASMSDGGGAERDESYL